MKFDKETIIVLVIAALIMAGWFYLYPQYQAEQAEKLQQQKVEQLKNQNAIRQQKAEEAANVVPAVEKKTVVKETAAAGTEAAVKTIEEKAASVKETLPVAADMLKPVVLENKLVKFTFDPATGTLISTELKTFKKNVNSAEGENLILKPEGEAKRSFYAGDVLSAKSGSFHIVEDGNRMMLTRYLPDFKVEETFTLQPGSYTLDVTYKITNTSTQNRELKDLTFWAAGMPPILTVSDDRINTDRHYIDFCLADGETDWFTPDFDEDGELHEDYETGIAAKWVGSTNKYFASLLISKDNFKGGLRFEQTLLKQEQTIPSVGAGVSDVKLAPGETISYDMQYYCGPKELARVEALEETALDAMHIAYWSWFEFIARPIARFLVWLGKLIKSYGIAIILLTLLVRALLWPLVQKSNNSMRKMQKIQPKVKELREKYKDDPQELNMRMMELYRTEGVNPLGGCLPMLLQIPIFFAMYSVFDSAVELRHVSFLWAKDLAQPDSIGPEIFGLQLHPLILMMTALMILQQKMTPSQMEPMQQKIMMAMPIIMLVMLYNLPSGLTLYWTVSQAVSIIQLKVSQKIAEKDNGSPSGKTNTAKAK
ncbi:MAG: membrane protein insertase YidC [Lentisphaeria bacterium]|nr:membrane protein insertase YidC [Lentisphaeria bacterium]